MPSVGIASSPSTLGVRCGALVGIEKVGPWVVAEGICSNPLSGLNQYGVSSGVGVPQGNVGVTGTSGGDPAIFNGGAVSATSRSNLFLLERDIGRSKAITELLA